MTSTAANTGRKIFKILGILLASVFGLVLLASLLFLTFLEPIAERFLKQQVAKSTDGLYTLQLADIDLEILTGTLVLYDVHLSPNSAVHRQQRAAGEASPQLFDIRSPHVKIAGANWLGALISKQVRIGTVLLEQPTITFLHDNQVQKNPAQKTGGKGKGISSFLKSLHIDEIQIPDATYRYLTLGHPVVPRHEVSQISLWVNDFQLDDLDQPDHTKLLHADAIRVEARNYTYHSPDSVYDVQVGLFTYSSKEGELVADSVKIHSNHEVNSALGPGKSSRSIYDIEVPLFRITGLDVVEAYQTKQLQIKQILLQKPDFNVLKNTNIPTASDFPDLAALYRKISDYLRVVEVGEFRVADGSLVLRNKVEEIFTVHRLQKANLAVQGIRVDSVVLFSPRDNFFAKEILLSGREYSYQHPQDPHTVKVAQVQLSTRDQYFQADSIQVIGDQAVNDRLKQAGEGRLVIYDVNLPLLRISNMDVIQVLETPHLDIGRILLRQPTVSAYYDRSVQVPDLDVTLQQIYRNVSGFVSRLRVGEVRLEEVTYAQYAENSRVQQTQKLEHGSLVATSLLLDSTFFLHPGRELPLEEVVVEARDYTYWLPNQVYTFHLGSLRYSTRSQELTARSIEVNSNAQANNQLKQVQDAKGALFDLSAQKFRVTGLDLVKAYNTNQLVVDQVILRQPHLDILQVRGVAASSGGGSQQGSMEQVFAVADPIRARSIRLEDGTITYREQRDTIVRTHVLNHASATVTGLHLTPHLLNRIDEKLPMQEMTLTAQDYIYQSPDGIYTAKLDSLHYGSRQQVLTARSLDLVSDKEAHARQKRENPDQANRNLFDVSARKFQITGLDLIRAYETGKLTMTEILLAEPEVAILQDQNVPQAEGQPAGSAGTEGVMKQVSDLVEVFRVGNLRVADGSFKLSILKDTVLRSQQVEQVSLNLAQFRLVSMEANDPLEMFAVDDIGLLVRDYSYLTPDSLYLFEVGEVRSSLRQQSVSIENLRLAPLFKKEDFAGRLEYANDRYDIKLPSVELQGMDLAVLFNRQDLIVRKALLDKLVLNIYRDNRVQQDPGRRPVTLQNMLRKIDFYVRVDSLLLEDGRLSYSEIPPGGKDPGVLVMEEMMWELTNLTNDSVLIKQNNIASFKASTLMMGKGELEVAINLYLDHPEDLYTYKGTIAPMDLEAFNPLFKNLTAVKLESGQLNKLSFAVEATAHQAVGQMVFLYDDLNIQLLDPEDPGDPGFLRNAGSWLINKLVVKSDNPAGNREPRVGEIAVDRNYQKSVFNHMSKAMMDGLTSSLMTPFVERIVDKFVSF